MTPEDVTDLHALPVDGGRAYYAANREKILAKAKAWYGKNRQAKKEYDAAYRKANLSKINERFRLWRAANLASQKAKDQARRDKDPEHYAAKGRAWRVKNVLYLKAYEAARNAANPQRAAPWSRAWKAAHPEARRNHVRNRRAKLKAGGILSRGIEKFLMAAQNGECNICRASLALKFHLDHVVPVSKGGRNEDDNVQLLCPPCNQSKGAKPQIEFMRSRDGYL